MVAAAIAVGAAAADGAGPTDAAGWQGLLGDRPAAAARRALGRRAPPPLARRPGPRGRRPRERGADEGVDAPGGRRPEASDRAARPRRRADPAGAVVRPRPQRVLGLARSEAPADPRERSARSRASTRCGLPTPPRWRSTRCSATTAFGPGSGRRPEIVAPRRRRTGRDRRAARHRRRPHAPLHARPRPPRDRRPRAGRRPPTRVRTRRKPGGRSVTAPSSRASSSGSGRARPASTAWRPARASCRSASPAGSPTRAGASRSTAAPTRSSRGSRPPSTRTTTATRTTRPGSRSSASSSRSPPSRTARSPRAAAGAVALDTLVVAPAGNDGPAGPGYGSIGAPGGAPAALAVGAIDARRAVPDRCTCSCARGCACSSPAPQPLGGALAPTRDRAGPGRRARAERAASRWTRADPLERLFDGRVQPRRRAPPCCCRAGPTSPEIVRELAAAGARAVIVDGPVPAGSLGVDEPVEVPILGLDRGGRRRGPDDARRRRSRSSSRSVRRRPARTTSAARRRRSRRRGSASTAAPKPELRRTGRRARDLRARADAGRRRPLRDDQRHQRLRGRSSRVRRRCSPTHDPISTPRACGGRSSPARRDARPAPAAGVGVVDPSGVVVGRARRRPARWSASRRSGRDVDRQRGPSPSGTSRAARSPSGSSPSSAQPGSPWRSRAPALSLPAGALEGRDSSPSSPASLPDPPSAISGAIRVGRPSAVGRCGCRGRSPCPVTRARRSRPRRSPSATFAPDDHEPAVLTFVAGRVDGSAERPQLLPVETLEVDLWRGARTHRDARAAPRPAAGAVRDRGHGARAAGRRPAAGRVRAAAHRDARSAAASRRWSTSRSASGRCSPCGAGAAVSRPWLDARGVPNLRRPSGVRL